MWFSLAKTQQRSRCFLLIAALFASLALTVSASAQEARFVSPPDGEALSADGVVALVWEVEGLAADRGLEFEVRRWQADAAGEGVLVYQGSDRGTFVSGLPEGEFVFRVRVRVADELFEPWPESGLFVQVKYPDRFMVWVLMAAGGITLILTAGTIVRGYRKTAGEAVGG